MTHNFSEIFKKIEKFKPYESPKHIIEEAMSTTNTVAIRILFIGIIFGLIYRLIGPDIDKETVLIFKTILLLFFYTPYVFATAIMIGSIIHGTYRFLSKLIHTIRSSESIKELLKPKRDSILCKQQDHDRAYVIQLGQELSLADLKYYEKNFDRIIKNNENQISNILGNQAAFFPMIILVVTFIQTFNGIDSTIRFFSLSGEYRPLDPIVFFGMAAITLIVIAVLMQKINVGKYVYWHGLFRLAVEEQQTIADWEAKKELQEILHKQAQTQKIIPFNKSDTLSISQRLRILFTGKN